MQPSCSLVRSAPASPPRSTRRAARPASTRRRPCAMSDERPARALLRASALVKGYRTPAGYVPVLQALDLEVADGEMLAITGASGVGKSTLLHVLGTLDRPESGAVSLGDEDVFALDEQRLRMFRNRTIGFVFQFHHLLPEFNALENVAMPLLVGRRPASEAFARAHALLDE